MAENDPELIARALRWCAEAGRSATEAEVRRALEPLGWDELLALKALLADPPPARPLGPNALADIARGVSPETAAEREREGRYLREDEAATPAPPVAEGPGETAPPRRAARERRRKGAAAPRVRRARDRATESAAPEPAPPLIDALQAEEGRAVVEQLVRRHGARRDLIVAALASAYRRADGTPPDAGDLQALLDAHGLARAFARRERDLALHALRAAGGVRSRAAERLGITPDAFGALLERLGASDAAERIREERRRDLRTRATLSERAQLLLTDEARLADLGVLEEIVADLAARLPDHLRALQAAGERNIPAALGRSLSVSRAGVERLAVRLSLRIPSPARAELGPARRGVERRGADGRDRRVRPSSGPGRPRPPGGSRPGGKPRRGPR